MKEIDLHSKLKKKTRRSQFFAEIKILILAYFEKQC